MSTAEFAQKVVSIVHQSASARFSGVDFEMAYQARVAADRIRFAIRQIEQPQPNRDALQEAGMQLLDALDRLESAEQGFQLQFHRSTNREESLARSAREIGERNEL